MTLDGPPETSARGTVETPTAVTAGRTPVLGSAVPAKELEQLTADIIVALKTVYDPEIPADIYELGLIYKIDIDGDRKVAIEMTLTAPGCRSPARCRYGSRTPPIQSRASMIRSRRGTRTACRTKPSSCSICSDGTTSCVQSLRHPRR
jgi:hypothetical protein